MRGKVTAILVARGGGEYLERTLQALEDSSRRADRVVLVEIGTNARDTVVASDEVHRLSVPDHFAFGQAVAAAVRVLPEAESDDEWLWLLGADNAPDSDALAALLSEIEISPSVAVAGPKQMQWADPGYIYSFGDTMTPSGAAVEIAEPELDQAQYDRESDVLAVAAGGMIVRRRLWDELKGFDSGLPAVDDALDFCVRARLAGHRVVLVPGARILSAGRHSPGTSHLGARSSRSKRARLARTAQLHRRMVYAKAWTLPLHWLALVPLAIIRAIGQLLSKRPGRVIGEFRAAFAVALVHGGSVAAGRKRIARTRRTGWNAIAPLRLPWPEVRRRRALLKDQVVSARRAGSHPIEFVQRGGAWTVLALAVIGGIMHVSLIGAAAVSAPGLLPLGSIGDLWGNLGYGWRSVGAGFRGAADPFAWVLAILGSTTFWAPSLAIVLLYLLVLPLAGLGAWFAAARLTARPTLRALAAGIWALSPTLLVALHEGRLGAVMVHLLLPWLAFALSSARRSWTAAATAGLLAAAVVAGAPSLIPALLIAWVVAVLGFAFAGRRGRGWHRLVALPLPAASLFAPLVIIQFLRGTPLAIFADPGVVLAFETFPDAMSPRLSSVLTMLAGTPTQTAGEWSALAAAIGLDVNGAFVVAALAVPLLIAAFAAPFLPRSARGVASLAIAALGFITAVVALRIELVSVDGVAVPIWPGSALSLYLLGVVGAAVTALEASGSRVGRAARGVVAGLVLVGVGVSAAPLLVIGALGEGGAPGTTTTVPALVTAEAATDPTIGTLVIDPADGGLSGRLERGAGSTLDEQSTLYDSSRVGELSGADETVAVLVGNLASQSGYDAASDLDALRIGFVLLSPDPEQPDLHDRVAAALDSNSLFSAVATTERGTLWRYVGLDEGLPVSAPVGPGTFSTPTGLIVIVSQLLILGSTLLLALPTGGLAERVRPEREVRRGAGLSRRKKIPSATVSDDDSLSAATAASIGDAQKGADGSSALVGAERGTGHGG